MQPKRFGTFIIGGSSTAVNRTVPPANHPAGACACTSDTTRTYNPVIEWLGGAMMTGLNLRRATALVLVPMILVIADVAANRTALKFLLLPPLGALTYLVFVNPARVDMNLRRIVVAPTATAALAWLAANWLGYNAVSVATVTVGTMLILWILRSATIVPPLALALLTVLLYKDVRGQVDYILSVFIFTAALYLLYRLWLRLPLDRGEIDDSS